MIDVIQPTWPAPPQVRALTTTRTGGYSLAPFDTFNLATHVGDNQGDVHQNRDLLLRKHKLPHAPLWLAQNHTTTVICADLAYESYPAADASFSLMPERVCAVLTADCLPLLVCDLEGTQVAAIHAGWRGLAEGIVPATIKQLKAQPKNLMVWLGPAIGPEVYEVREEVRDAFLKAKSAKAEHFKDKGEGAYLLDLYSIARYQLEHLGVHQIYGGEYCTYSDPERFFSFRRNNVTGRMASVIWLEKS